MKKFFFFIVVLSGSFLVRAQNAVYPGNSGFLAKNSYFATPAVKFTSSDSSVLIEEAISFLKSYDPNLDYNGSLVPEILKSNPLGTHLTFNQSYLGIPIFGTDVTLNISRSLNLVSLSLKTTSTLGWPVEPDKSAETKIPSEKFDHSIQSPAWFVTGSSALQVIKVESWNNDGSAHILELIDITGGTIYSHDLGHYNKTDSLATIYAFYPDPLTSAAKPYGFPYIDAQDSGIPALNFERVPFQVRVAFAGNDSFYLSGPYMRIVDNSLPNTPPTFSKTGVFLFSRSNPGFEDGNVFFHISNYQSHIKKLGFDSLGNYQVLVDAHAENGADQSEFIVVGSERRLLFGTGGIDDAEDADVITHEYTHSLVYDAVGSEQVFGYEREALDEGLCDYMACSYSRNISSYNWQKIYNWDGNETWGGRSCMTPKSYPSSMKMNDVHLDGEIWSSALMDVYETLGRDKADALMLGELYLVSKYISMETGAKLYLKADSLLFNAKDISALNWIFVKRGLLQANYLGIAADEDPEFFTAWFTQSGLIYVRFKNPESGKAEIIDMQGKLISTSGFSNASGVNIVTGENLSAGIYLLHLVTSNADKTVKLLKP